MTFSWQKTKGEIMVTKKRNKITKDFVLSTLIASDPKEREQLLENYLRKQVARIIGSASTKLDIYQPLNRLGVDSLMAVEIKNHLEADLGIPLPIRELLQGPSIARLKSHLLDQLNLQQSVPLKDHQATNPAFQEKRHDTLETKIKQQTASQILERLDQFNEDELDELIKTLQEDLKGRGRSFGVKDTPQ